jgi:hypothetical protein
MEPNPLAIYALCILGAAGLVFVFWLNHKWVTRHQPKRETATKKARAGALEIALAYIMGRAEPVNDYEDGGAAVMSHARNNAPESSPLSLRTDSGRASDGQFPRQMKSEELLTVYALMRKYNIPREEARAALKAAGLPLGNDVWTQAAPPAPEEPQTITPIAGRPTNAQFHDDPELVYHPLEQG